MGRGREGVLGRWGEGEKGRVGLNMDVRWGEKGMLGRWGEGVRSLSQRLNYL